MFHFFGKTDVKIREDVINEIKWDPSVTATDVSVSADHGIVTLRGNVPHYSEKTQAEEAAQRVGGVRAVADEIEVNIMGSHERSDTEIAEAAVNALEWSYSVPKGIKASVRKGWLTLRGEAEWDYQRTAAKTAVSQLMGVTGVSYDISIRSQALPKEVKGLIESALKRSAESEGRSIDVAVSGNCVTLSGNVHSYAEIEDARKAAWMAPGVLTVINNLKITQ